MRRAGSWVSATDTRDMLLTGECGVASGSSRFAVTERRRPQRVDAAFLTFCPRAEDPWRLLTQADPDSGLSR